MLLLSFKGRRIILCSPFRLDNYTLPGLFLVFKFFAATFLVVKNMDPRYGKI